MRVDIGMKNKTVIRLKFQSTIPECNEPINTSQFNANMLDIDSRVFNTWAYNFQVAHMRITNGLNIAAWHGYFHDYSDNKIVDYLEFQLSK